MGSSSFFEFNKCCFCIDLKTGCFIIGYLSLIGYVIATIGLIVTLAVGSYFAVNGDGRDSSSTNTIGGEPDIKPETIGLIVVIASVILLLFVVVLVTFVIVLLVGLHKNKPGHVKAYLVYSVVFMVLSLIYTITIACNGQAQRLFPNITGLIINLYFLLVIRSQYLAMKNPSAARGPAIYTS